MTTRILPALVAAAALAVPAAAFASDYRAHRISYTTNTATTMSGASVSFLAPATWTTLHRTDARHLSFHSGSGSCRYSITWTTVAAPDADETAAERVAGALPVPSSAYLLDAGTRGAAAWRVTRLRTTDGRVRLRARRSDRHSLGAGRRGWQDTIVSAVSLKGSECHTGTYREVLGPQIGTGLAAATSRIYAFARRRG